MILAHVRAGRIETDEPIPEEWEGQAVMIVLEKDVPLTPDDPHPDLEEHLAALKALGPTEYEPGERELIAQMQAEEKRLSLVPVQENTDREP